MDLATMRTKLVDMSANTLSASDTTTLDELLNGAYQSTIPGLLTGEETEGFWDLSTADGTQDYAYPSWFISAKRKAPRFTGSVGYSLEYVTYPEVFWSRYDINDTSEARPCTALFYGRTVSLRPIPDAVYTIRIWGRIGKATALTTSGLDDRNMALASVAMAAIEHAELTGNEEVKMAAQSVWDRHFPILLTQSLARSRGPRARVSF